jgi:membrane protease YdiL (CAAX protease family)
MDLSHRKFLKISKETWQFLLNPSLEFSFNRFKKSDVLSFVFATSMVFSMLGGWLSDTLSSLLGFSEVADKGRMEKFSHFELVLYGSILVPILEEFAFRLYLYPKKTGIAVSTAFFAYLFSSRIVFGVESINLSEFFFKRMTIAFLSGTLSYLLLISISDSVLDNVFRNRFRWIFYCSVLLFGCVHVSNYAPFGILTFLLAPLLTLPQIVMGIGFGYVRVRYGLLYAIFLHGFINLIPVLAILFK